MRIGWLRIFVFLVILGPCFGGQAKATEELDELYGSFGSYLSANRLLDALDVAERAVATAEKTYDPTHPNLAVFYANLGTAQTRLFRLKDGEGSFLKALAIDEPAFANGWVPPESLLVDYLVLANNFDLQRDTKNAEYYGLTALKFTQFVYPEMNLEQVKPLRALANIYRNVGALANANRIYGVIENLYEYNGQSHDPIFARDLIDWGMLLNSRGLTDQAEALISRAVEIAAQSNDVDLQISADLAMGQFLAARKKTDGARRVFGHALHLAGFNFGDKSIQFARAAGEYSKVAGTLHETDEALKFMEKSIEAYEHGEYASSNEYIDFRIIFSAELLDLKQPERNEKLLEETAKIMKLRYPIDSDRMQVLNDAFGDLYAYKRDWPRAMSYYRDAFSVLAKHSAAIRGGSARLYDTDPAEGLLDRGQVTEKFIGAAANATPDLSLLSDDAFDELWQAAQMAGISSVAHAIGAMAERRQSGNSQAAKLLRERQDLLREHATLESTLLDAGTIAGKDDDVAIRARNSERNVEISNRIADIDRNLSELAPTVRDQASAETVSVQALQSKLQQNEAVLLYLDTRPTMDMPGQTFLFVVTRSQRRVVPLQISPDELFQKVQQFRHSIGIPQGRGATPIAPSSPALSEIVLDASSLYKDVFREALDLLDGIDTLDIVASRSLSSLPFNALVRSPIYLDKAGAKPHWLVRDYAISILPTVSSLVRLRADQESEQSTKNPTFLGVGNPLLSGRDGGDRRAWAKKDCVPVDIAAPNGLSIALSPSTRDLGENGTIDLDAVQHLQPLPETFDELCTVATSLGGSAADLLTGAAATEARLKEMSDSGQLMDRSVIEFATHGLVSGDLGDLREPAIVLTPPSQPNEADDGLLRASEISNMKLNADWVILSACNTAAAASDTGEPLTGLAQSFFYAGARTLMVSHWSVYSQAAVAITTKTIKNMVLQPERGKAKALQAALVSIMDEGNDKSQPAYWAPFFVVGDGAAAHP